ncbi:WecB/TagA/CpsF family glycosyltransferase [bacterium]|nr:WecB/TagA/CpsF family glycosyltransferase [bacterium]
MTQEPQRKPEEVDVLGVRMHLAPAALFHALWDDAIHSRDRITVTAPHFHILLDAARSTRLRDYLNHCTYNHLDGIAAWLGVRLLTGRKPDRLTGTDTMLPWLDRHFRDGTRIYVLGGSLLTSDTLMEHTTKRYPGAALRCHHGMIDAGDSAVLEDIRGFAPEVLLVSLGTTLQFEWLRMHRDALDIPVVVATGGFVEFLAGRRPRAPRWMRALGLEWLHRLVHEPGRLWQRYLLGFPSFLFHILRQRLRRAS